MRDESFIEREEARLFGPSLVANVKTGLAAGAALAVLSGLVVWGYRLSARDPADVPVIRAMAGPARSAPEEAEGAQFAHQDRDVYDAITDQDSAGGAGGLAPPPARLDAADEAAASLGAQREAEAAQARAAALAAEPRAAAPRPAPVAPPAPEIADADAGAEVDRLVASALQAAPAVAPRDAPAAPQAAPPAGTASVKLQLGAYLSREDAEANWAQLRRKHPELGAHEAAITPITSRGRNLLALRVNTLSDAAQGRALCAALKARGGECFLVGGG